MGRDVTWRTVVLVVVSAMAMSACRSPDPTQTPLTTPTSTPAITPASTPTARVTPQPTGPTPDSGLFKPARVERAYPRLSFERLTNLAQPATEHHGIFVTEQEGRILLFADDQDTAEAMVFLDLRDRVRSIDNEEGLLGLAFAPDFERRGYFYVYYSASAPRRSVLSRFRVTEDDPTVADPASELVVLEVPQPFQNHNGGQIAFGPDGYLYIGLGDGGAANDPAHNGQDLGTLLGALLRIDVAGASPSQPYRIPPDNPFTDTPGAREEIWAYGLRNPWRFSFDAETGLLWVADVGQGRWEEVDVVTKGANLGWNTMEGAHCFNPPLGCNSAGLVPPVAEYGHDLGCSVTGGYVYRGIVPSLYGAYIYGDFCSGKIWGLRYDGESVTEHALLVESGLEITSFGQDLAGNIYVLSRNEGIFRLVPE